MCVGGGGSGTHESVLYITYILIKRNRPVCSYTFYKPTLGPKYVSNIPYNEFITPTTFIKPIIGIFNGIPLPIFDVGYTVHVPWTQSMPSRDVNAVTRLAEASWRRDNSVVSLKSCRDCRLKDKFKRSW